MLASLVNQPSDYRNTIVDFPIDLPRGYRMTGISIPGPVQGADRSVSSVSDTIPRLISRDDALPQQIND